MKTVYVETNSEDPQRMIVIPDDKSQSFFIKPVPVSGVPTDSQIKERFTLYESKHGLRRSKDSIYGATKMRDEIMLPALAALTAENKALSEERDRMKEAKSAIAFELQKIALMDDEMLKDYPDAANGFRETIRVILETHFRELKKEFSTTKTK